MENFLRTIRELQADAEFANDRKRALNLIKKFFLSLFRAIILLGISFVILGPILRIIASSFFSNSDAYNPMVYLIPSEPTVSRYSTVYTMLKYVKRLINTFTYVLILMVMQVFICSMVGYGFARFEFPFKKLFFGCVVVMIVLPLHAIMLPLYMTFRNFFGINLMNKQIPMYIMTAFGTGLRAGLYIYIFNQFFRGLPKEIEEAAFVDGAGMWYTYFHIMLVNAMPAVITVAVFSIVWQYNDTFFGNLFLVPNLLSKEVSSLVANISNQMTIMDPKILELYLNTGIVLVVLPVLLIYMVLQRQFIEGVERSGIVG